MTDRHHRNVAPLYKDGRLFVPGDNQVIAVDAYNGTPLWQRDFTRSRRLGAFLDCSNMVVDDSSLFLVAQDVCHVLDPARGDERRTFSLPGSRPEASRHWGYLARTGDVLVGSATRPQASYYDQSRDADAALWYDNMSLVTSDELFALDPGTGAPRWTYASGLLINTTLTLGGGRVYFVESHSPSAVGKSRGRAPMADFLAGPNFLVALDLESGKTIWKQPVDLGDCRHIIYLNYAREKLLLSGNRYVEGLLWYFF
jgi:outer membrane protein assembly factor BamB